MFTSTIVVLAILAASPRPQFTEPFRFDFSRSGIVHLCFAGNVAACRSRTSLTPETGRTDSLTGSRSFRFPVGGSLLYCCCLAVFMEAVAVGATTEWSVERVSEAVSVILNCECEVNLK